MASNHKNRKTSQKKQAKKQNHLSYTKELQNSAHEQGKASKQVHHAASTSHLEHRRHLQDGNHTHLYNKRHLKEDTHTQQKTKRHLEEDTHTQPKTKRHLEEDTHTQQKTKRHLEEDTQTQQKSKRHLEEDTPTQQKSKRHLEEDSQTQQNEYLEDELKPFEFKTTATHKKHTTRNLTIASIILTCSFLSFTILSIVFYQKYRPEQFIAGVMNAIQTQNADALVPYLSSQQLTISAENAQALVQAFSQEESQKKLEEQLQVQVLDQSNKGTYSALHVEKEPVFLGFGKYILSLSPVSLFLRSDAQNLLLSLNGTTYTGEIRQDGVLYQTIFPGRYTAIATGSSALGQALNGVPTQLDLLQTDQPAEFHGALPVASVTVSGIPNDEATLYIDGTEIPQRAVNGSVTLPQVAINSVISMKHTTASGTVTTASVAFTDATVTQLTFSELNMQGGTPDEATINTLLNAYYASFFYAANEKDITKLTGATAQMIQSAAAQMNQEPFQNKVLQHVNAAVNPASVKITKADEPPTFRCNIALAYAFTNPEETTAHNIVTHETVEFIFEQDAWLVHRTAPIDEGRFLSPDVSALDITA